MFILCNDISGLFKHSKVKKSTRTNINLPSQQPVYSLFGYCTRTIEANAKRYIMLFVRYVYTFYILFEFFIMLFINRLITKSYDNLIFSIHLLLVVINFLLLKFCVKRTINFYGNSTEIIPCLVIMFKIR